MDQGQTVNDKDLEGRYSLINDTAEDVHVGIYDKPLPCFGCGIGWFSFLLGFAFPVMWYYATILYFGSYYRKDPRERSGLAACAVAVILPCSLTCTVAVIIILAVLLFFK